MKNKYWSKTLPLKEGWYWFRYEGKHGIVVCPAQLCFFKDGTFFVRTARNDSLHSYNVDSFGEYHFGASIEMPSSSLKL